MKLHSITIEPEIEEKILRKHRITQEELKHALEEGKPKFFVIRSSVYMAITHLYRYLTVIFDYDGRNGKILTAYESSDWQIRRYNKS